MNINQSKEIIRLPQDLVLRIAAGEVIERPASVVKELIENSIDANSDKIEVEIINGGKDLIKVSDNGTGIEKKYLPLVIERHTTSKIRKLDDLFQIKTLGFRGEALASIASVSKLTIITKTENQTFGSKLIKDNQEIKIEDTACNRGTTVIVKDLFYNTPVRKKFLKSTAVESKHIYDIVYYYSICYPEIDFKLSIDGEQKINKPRTKTLYETSQYLLPKEIIKNIVSFETSKKYYTENKEIEVRINTLVGKPTISRKDTNYFLFFVNDRFVKSDLISKAVTDSYNTTLFLDRKPVIILKLYLPYDQVDVNVHPSKTEIKFIREQEIYKIIFESIREAIINNNMIEQKNIQQKKLFNKKNKNPFQLNREYHILKEQRQDNQNHRNKYAPQDSSVQNYLKEPEKQYETKRIEETFRILGQIHKTYIIAETKKGLAIIDQHAAQERVNYERLLKELKNKNISKQKLIKPIIITPKGVNFELISENIERIKQFGFEIESFGSKEFIIRAIPSIYDYFDEKDIESLLFEISQEFNLRDSSDLISQRIIFTMACRKSIKAGYEISIQESYNLLKELFECEKPYTCPHGRPTIIELDQEEISKMFKRT